MRSPRRFAAILFPVMLFAVPTVVPALAAVGSHPAERGADCGKECDPCHPANPPRDVSAVVDVREDCNIYTADDPERIGTTRYGNIWLAVCETGEPDDQCDVQVSQPITKTGAEAEDGIYSVTPGQAVQVVPPTTVCGPFIGCHTVPGADAPTRIKATAFSSEGPAEVETWTPTGGHFGADPDEICASNDDNNKCTGSTGNGNASVDGSPTGWLITN